MTAHAVVESVHDQILREADLLQAGEMVANPREFPALWALYCWAVDKWEQVPATSRKSPPFRYRGREYAISESNFGRLSVWTADRKRKLVSGSAGAVW